MVVGMMIMENLLENENLSMLMSKQLSQKMGDDMFLSKKVRKTWSYFKSMNDSNHMMISRMSDQILKNSK